MTSHTSELGSSPATVQHILQMPTISTGGGSAGLLIPPTGFSSGRWCHFDIALEGWHRAHRKRRSIREAHAAIASSADCHRANRRAIISAFSQSKTTSTQGKFPNAGMHARGVLGHGWFCTVPGPAVAAAGSGPLVHQGLSVCIIAPE
jgi:hypothetical protein